MKMMIKIYLLIALSTVLFSCKKYLEQPPDNRTALNTVDKVKSLLSSAYPKASYVTFCEAMSDNADDKMITHSDRVNRTAYFFEDSNSQDLDTPNFYWDGCYAAIAAANQVLQVIDKASDSQKYKAQKGEALVARAYAHFMLVTLFSKVYNPGTSAADAGIPYVTEPEKVVFKKYDRKTVADVYSQIEQDLLQGMSLIDNSVYGVPKYHFTTSAAHAFAARFYLFKKEYIKVIEHANAAISGGSLANFLRPINTLGYQSLEYNTRRDQYTAATTEANLLLVEAQSVWARAYPSYRFGYTNFVASQTMNAPNVTKGKWAYTVYGNEDVLNIPKFSEQFVRATVNANIGDPYIRIPLFTAEELLFNRAEANAYLGRSGDVLNDLNDFARMRISNYDPNKHRITTASIRSFYATNDTDGLIKTILDFKRLEFLFEGQRWFDMLRHQIPVAHRSSEKMISISANDPRRVLQLPAEVSLAGLSLNPR